jgi:serine/threonine protein kinase
MPSPRPSDFEGRPLSDLQDFLDDADASAIGREWGDNVEWRTRIRYAGGATDEPAEAPTVFLADDRDDTHVPLERPEIAIPNVDIHEYLGGGQFGWVYSGRVKGTGLVVAVKVLRRGVRHDDEDTARRARSVIQEAIIGAKLGHRNIVGVFDLRPTSQFWIILMELVQGKRLRRSEIGAEPEKVRRCFGQLADALCTMAARNIVHRDIKPDNIVIRRQDGSPVVVDLGVAVDMSVTDLSEAGIAGTPLFMSPEAFRGEITSACDAYSLGVTAVDVVGAGSLMTGYGNAVELIRAKASGKFHDHVLDVIRSTEDAFRAWIVELISDKRESRLKALQEGRKWASGG